MDATAYSTFLVAVVAIILTPGPAQAFVISRTLADGWRSGCVAAIGLNTATLCHAGAAALGLSAVLAASATAFAVVKYAGAAYLVYLGIKVLRSPGREAEQVAPGRNAIPVRTVFRDAVIAGLLNPKVAIFFIAFLPQFVDFEHGNVILQFLLMGATMASIDAVYECLLVLAVVRLQRHTRSARFERLQNRLSGCVMLGLGCRLALQER